MPLLNNPGSRIFPMEQAYSEFVWGTVQFENPLSIRLDGETSPIGVAIDSLVDRSLLRVGDRVRCEFDGRRLIVWGIAGGTPWQRLDRPRGVLAYACPNSNSQQFPGDGGIYYPWKLDPVPLYRDRMYRITAFLHYDLSTTSGYFQAWTAVGNLVNWSGIESRGVIPIVSYTITARGYDLVSNSGDLVQVAVGGKGSTDWLLASAGPDSIYRSDFSIEDVGAAVPNIVH